ncbi:hypothetical protein EYB26_006998 [Talaromyces marneffei]|uniref:WD repeat protein n=1 Tax=Talaromyces marneffei (strain ATCC 18224 / CBS 334.59 / QM 7333) TaxID=441960 RepID=B6QHU4_TALMQ|nr:uncharacterized protein EYB26_006998 [Talaromyces marneffei]EEA22939.1 WD repeat protein [Talaromyces marneffei ATCC 18224]QGA19309.1 hypothetical protein EYB26_006998 [Talaromyces marneffei]
MSSSDKDQDAEHLLSKFQFHRRPLVNDNPSASFSNIGHQATPPRRRGRPPKRALVFDLAASESSQQQDIPPRPRGRPKKNPVALLESPDSENSQPVQHAVRRRRLHAGSSLDSPGSSSVDALQSPGLQTSHVTHDNFAAVHHSNRHSKSSTPQQTGAATTSSRSRRSRAQVGNYYSNANYSGYISVSEAEHEIRSESQSQQKAIGCSSRPVVPFTSRKPEQKRIQVIYDAQGVRITRHGYTLLQDIPNLPNTAPYSPQSKPSSYARQFRSKSHIPLLHVSFSEDEVSAIIGLLSPYGVDPRLFEMSQADQVIHIVKSVHSNRLERVLEELPQMIQLQDLLNDQGFDNLMAYHQAADSADSFIDNLCNEMMSKQSTFDQISRLLVLAGALRRRRKADIQAFCMDTRSGVVPTKPFYISASYQRAPIRRSEHRVSVLDRWPKRLSEEFTLQKSHTWKGASNDVLNLAWSPDGFRFAVGAAAQCDEHNMQYNRSNNLILGDYTHKIIKELPDHRVPYPVANHNNSHLYMSVTAVQWFDDTLYTSSYDKTVKIWDVSSYTNATCRMTLRHDHKVQIMARSPSIATLLATGTDSTLHLWHFDSVSQACLDLNYMEQRITRNPRAIKESDFTPSSLAWGLSTLTQDLFVAGFSGNGHHGGDACREGLLAAWKVAQGSLVPVPLQPNAQNIFDVKSHPFLPWFATGSSVSAVGRNGTGKDIRSLVRIYEPSTKPRCAIELDCPALDINDVSFCPMDRFHISASCTDGITYVWDFRNPSQILHKLCHGDAINQLDEELTREQADVGVRVALWGKGSDEFITGGSDGVLRSWDILRAPEDVHVRDIAVIEDEIMSGAFSPDKSTLLIGDAAGGIHILEPGLSSDPVEQLHYELSRDTELSVSSDSGRAIGKMLLETGQLIQHPRYGVGKGAAYQGPYAAWARPEKTPNNMLAVTPLIAEIQALQLDQGTSNLPAGDHIIDELRKTAEIRNRDPSLLKRKDSPHHRPKKKHRATDIINLCSDEEEDAKPLKPSRKSAKPPVWIDLTENTDDEDSGKKVITMRMKHEENSDDDAEDYWFPDSREIDPNIRSSD